MQPFLPGYAILYRYLVVLEGLVCTGLALHASI